MFIWYALEYPLYRGYDRVVPCPVIYTSRLSPDVHPTVRPFHTFCAVLRPSLPIHAVLYRLFSFLTFSAKIRTCCSARLSLSSNKAILCSCERNNGNGCFRLLFLFSIFIPINKNPWVFSPGALVKILMC